MSGRRDPPPGWHLAESQNLHRPYSCYRFGDTTGAYATEEEAVAEAWARASEESGHAEHLRAVGRLAASLPTASSDEELLAERRLNSMLNERRGRLIAHVPRTELDVAMVRHGLCFVNDEDGGGRPLTDSEMLREARATAAVMYPEHADRLAPGSPGADQLDLSSARVCECGATPGGDTPPGAGDCVIDGDFAWRCSACTWRVTLMTGGEP